MPPGAHQRRNRLRKIEWVHLSQRNLLVLNLVQKPGISARTRAKGLASQGWNPVASQVVKQEGRE